MLFLHESSVAEHREYYNKLCLKISILEKSAPELKGITVYNLAKARLDRALIAECLPLMWEAELHRVWFSSFCNGKFQPSATVRKAFGSEAAFLNMIYRMGMELTHGFVSVGIVEGVVRLCARERPQEHSKNGRIILAVDISEHAYFKDYGFDKDKYLREALPYLDLSRLN